MQNMKLSNFWFSSSRSVMVLLLLLGFYAWTPIPVSAATEYNQTIQFSDDFDSCSGERVFVAGTQHIVGRITEDSAGRLHFGFTRNTKGTGIGQISGDKYLLTDTVARAGLAFASGQVPTLIEQYNSRLIRQGEQWSTDDTILHFVSKITITADGNVIPILEIGSVECR